MTKNTYFRCLRRVFFFPCVYSSSAPNSRVKSNPPAETLTNNDEINKFVSGYKQRNKSDKVNWGQFLLSVESGSRHKWAEGGGGGGGRKNNYTGL